MALTFPKQARSWDPRRNVVNFHGEDGGNEMPCAISMEALVEKFGAGRGGKPACLAAFDRWQNAIRQKASDKCDSQKGVGSVLLRTVDFP